MTYSSIVSFNTVLMALVISAFNYLEVKCRDVINAYITDPIEGKNLDNSRT